MAGFFSLRSDVQSYDPRLEALSDAANRLHDFCLFYEGRTMVGVRRFTVAEVLARFPRWDEAHCQAAMEELEASGLVVYDPAARLVFASMTFDHSPVKGLNAVKGAAKRLAELQDSTTLLGPLEHVLGAMPEAEAEAAAKTKEKTRERAQADLARIENELQTRLERLQNSKFPRGGTKGDEAETSQAKQARPPMEGVSTPYQGGMEGVNGQSQHVGGVSPEPQDMEIHQGGMEGVCTPYVGGLGKTDTKTETETYTETSRDKTPPTPPAASAPQTQNTENRKGGQYAGLDQRRS